MLPDAKATKDGRCGRDKHTRPFEPAGVASRLAILSEGRQPFAPVIPPGEKTIGYQWIAIGNI